MPHDLLETYTPHTTKLQVKVKALKQTIMLLLSGESLPRVLMSVIRFCSNTDDHTLKKLLMLYWEVSPRPLGSLMIFHGFPEYSYALSPLL